MRLPLQRHTESEDGTAFSASVEVERRAPARLRLGYQLQGDGRSLALPAPAPPARTDELWRSTCFEAFVARPGGGYYEFNLSPSTQWAAYRFEGYRSGMAAAEPVPTPGIEGRFTAGGYRLDAELVLEGLPDLLGEASWRVGLSCILEGAQGGRSYWALTHPPGKPDFHHPDSFALDVPLTEPR